MGRHAGNGDEASPGRGKRGPESAPAPGHRDEPIGRRLRPEESMITEPQTGFLGSGWTSESKTSVTWPEDEERSGGRIKTTLLIVAAVAVVLGGTVFGIRALTGSEGSAADCPPTGCVTAASNQPELQPDPVGETEPEEPVPTDEPAEAGDRTAEATPPRPPPPLAGEAGPPPPPGPPRRERPPARPWPPTSRRPPTSRNPHPPPSLSSSVTTGHRPLNSPRAPRRPPPCPATPSSRPCPPRGAP